VRERGHGGILINVDFVRTGCGVLSSKIIRKRKAVLYGLYENKE